MIVRQVIDIHKSNSCIKHPQKKKINKHCCIKTEILPVRFLTRIILILYREKVRHEETLVTQRQSFNMTNFHQLFIHLIWVFYFIFNPQIRFCPWFKQIPLRSLPLGGGSINLHAFKATKTNLICDFQSTLALRQLSFPWNQCCYEGKGEENATPESIPYNCDTSKTRKIYF